MNFEGNTVQSITVSEWMNEQMNQSAALLLGEKVKVARETWRGTKDKEQAATSGEKLRIWHVLFFKSLLASSKCAFFWLWLSTISRSGFINCWLAAGSGRGKPWSWNQKSWVLYLLCWVTLKKSLNLSASSIKWRWESCPFTELAEKWSEAIGRQMRACSNRA